MRTKDFQRALALRPCARSEHFALHHVSASAAAAADELSTRMDSIPAKGVDDCCRLGLIVPKRLARRAATRNLVKRQGRSAFGRALPRLAHGDWLLRMRHGFDPKRFKSASSDALREAVGSELQALFDAAGRAPEAARPV